MITDGKFGKYGGTFVPELIIPALEELEEAFLRYKDDEKFNEELEFYLQRICRKTNFTILCKKPIKKVWDVKYI